MFQSLLLSLSLSLSLSSFSLVTMDAATKRNTMPEPESATIIINARSFWRRIARQNLETFQINLVYFHRPWRNLLSLSLSLSLCLSIYLLLPLSFFLFSPKLVRRRLNYGSMNAPEFVSLVAERFLFSRFARQLPRRINAISATPRERLSRAYSRLETKCKSVLTINFPDDSSRRSAFDRSRRQATNERRACLPTEVH